LHSKKSTAISALFVCSADKSGWGITMNKNKLRKFEDYEVDYYRKHPKELMSYLQVAFDEYQKDGDEKAFLSALRVVADAQGGILKIAKKTGLNRENLYRALSAKGNPTFSTINLILHSLGLSLKVVIKAA
jgi:probable addiction module antidote protein